MEIPNTLEAAGNEAKPFPLLRAVLMHTLQEQILPDAVRVALRDAIVEHLVSWSPGAVRILEERFRQQAQEGWATAHDDAHEAGELLLAGMGYADAVADQTAGVESPEVPFVWPWAVEWWKPSSDPGRNIEKAGALFAAEWDRRARAVFTAGMEPKDGKEGAL